MEKVGACREHALPGGEEAWSRRHGDAVSPVTGVSWGRPKCLPSGVWLEAPGFHIPPKHDAFTGFS